MSGDDSQAPARWDGGDFFYTPPSGIAASAVFVPVKGGQAYFFPYEPTPPAATPPAAALPAAARPVAALTLTPAPKPRPAPKGRAAPAAKAPDDGLGEERLAARAVQLDAANLDPDDHKWLLAHPEFPLFEDLKVTTITLIMALQGTVCLPGAHRLLEIPVLELPAQKRRAKKFKLPVDVPAGTILSSRFENDCRGVIRHADDDEKKKKTFFKNTITIDIATRAKNISVKLSPNTIQMCGVSSRDDGVEAAYHLLSHLVRIQRFLDLKRSAPARVDATLKALCEALQGPPRDNAQGRRDFALNRDADPDAAFEASRHLGVDRELLKYLFGLALDCAYSPEKVAHRYECLGEFVAGTLKYWFEGLDYVAESRTTPRRLPQAKTKRRPALPEPGRAPDGAGHSQFGADPFSPFGAGAEFTASASSFGGPAGDAELATPLSASGSEASSTFGTDPSWMYSSSSRLSEGPSGERSGLGPERAGRKTLLDAITLGSKIWESPEAPGDLGPEFGGEESPEFFGAGSLSGALVPAGVGDGGRVEVPGSPVSVVYMKNVMVNCNFELGFCVDRNALKESIMGLNGFTARFDNSMEHNVAIERAYVQAPDPFFPPKKDKVPRITCLIFRSGRVTISGDGSAHMRDTYYLLLKTIHMLRPMIEYAD